MKVVEGYPPNIALIRQFFKVEQNTIFAYGDTIYNPTGHELIDHVIAHEEIHERQQGDDPNRWWNRYIFDAEFRLDQEVEAYRRQYEFLDGVYTRPEKRRILKQISKDLASTLYGKLISEKVARKLIMNK